MKPARPKRTRQRAAAKASAPGLSKPQLEEIAEILGRRIADEALVTRAFTHPSAATAGRDGLESNQRLEFLGDRVLGLVIAERLFERRRTEREGSLAPRLNRLVNKRACADAAEHMRLGRFVIMAAHEIENGGRERESTLGDVCEAVIAALYLDGGVKAARAFIERAFAPQFAAQAERPKDPKTRLQEYAQGRGQAPPRYLVVSRSGPDHAPRFEVRAEIHGASATAQATSKQEAERRAAAAILEMVDET